MILKTIIICLLLAFAILCGIQFHNDPGYIYIRMHHTSIETTVAFALIAWAVLWYLVSCIIKLCRDIYQIPHTLKHALENWHTKRNNKPSHTALLQVIRDERLKTLEKYIQHGDTRNIEQLIQNLPRILKGDNVILERYATYLIQHKHYTQAEPLLVSQIKKSGEPQLLICYIQLPNASSAFLESLIKKYPESPTLFYALGFLCMRAQLWENALEYLEKSLAIKPEMITYRTLGELYEQLNRETEACQAYKTGLMDATIVSHACDKTRQK